MAVDAFWERFGLTNPQEVSLVSGVHAVNELFSLALPPILPLLITEFNLTYTRAGLLVTVYFAMYTIFQLPVGAVADYLGHTHLITVGMGVMAAGMALASLAPTYPLLLGAVALAGIGGSTYHPAGMSLVSDIEPDDTAGKAMGIHGLAGMLGSMLAPVLIGGLAVATNWRLALGVTAGLGLLYTLVFAIFSGSFSSSNRPPAVSASSALTTHSGKNHVQHLRADLRRFIQIPLAWWVLGLFLAKLLFTLQSYGVKTYLTLYVVERIGASAGTANTMFFLFLTGSALASIWFGSLADRFNHRRLLIATFLGAGGCIVATAFVPASVVILFGWFFLVGVLVNASLPVVNTLVSSYSEPEFSGSLFGIVQTASALGGTISPVVFGALASRVGIRVTFPLIAIISVVAGVGFLATGQRTFVSRFT